MHKPILVLVTVVLFASATQAGKREVKLDNTVSQSDVAALVPLLELGELRSRPP
jgi:hypothetical protein